VTENKPIKRDVQKLDIKKKIDMKNKLRGDVTNAYCPKLRGKLDHDRRRMVETVTDLMKGYSENEEVQQRLLNCFNR